MLETGSLICPITAQHAPVRIPDLPRNRPSRSPCQPGRQSERSV